MTTKDPSAARGLSHGKSRRPEYPPADTAHDLTLTTANTRAGVGSALVNALESFVVPLIQGNALGLGESIISVRLPRPNFYISRRIQAGLVADMSIGEGLAAKSQSRTAGDDKSHFGLTAEAQDLLNALKRYIVALVNPLADNEAINPVEDIEQGESTHRLMEGHCI